MKVSDLIKQLADLPNDAEIYMSQPSGDYWGTELAIKVDHIARALIDRSDYHDSDKVVEPRDGEEEVEGARHVWIIR